MNPIPRTKSHIDLAISRMLSSSIAHQKELSQEYQSLLKKIEEARTNAFGCQTITRNGNYFEIFHIPSYYATYATIGKLSNLFYLVRGWQIGRGDVFGYTVVFNTELKGIYDHYPK